MNAEKTVERSNLPNIVPMEFWVDHEAVGSTGEMKIVEYVKWARKASGMGGNALIVVEKVDRLKKHNAAIWEVIEPYYKAWKNGNDAPVDGTPLEIVAFVTKYQVQHLKMLHIRTIEDVAALTDGELEKVGMGSRELRERAIAFVKVKENESKMAVILADRDAKIANQAEEISKLTSSVSELAQRLDKLLAKDEKKSKAA